MYCCLLHSFLVEADCCIFCLKGEAGYAGEYAKGCCKSNPESTSLQQRKKNCIAARCVDTISHRPFCFFFLLTCLDFIAFCLLLIIQFETLTFRLISSRRSLGMKRMFTELWRGLSTDLWELYLVFRLISLLMLVIHNLLGLLISYVLFFNRFSFFMFINKEFING